MPKVSINNFRAGIQGSPGFTPDLRNVAASDMRNLTVDENGKLVRRAGRARGNGPRQKPPTVIYGSYLPFITLPVPVR